MANHTLPGLPERIALRQQKGRGVLGPSDFRTLGGATVGDDLGFEYRKGGKLMPMESDLAGTGRRLAYLRGGSHPEWVGGGRRLTGREPLSCYTISN